MNFKRHSNRHFSIFGFTMLEAISSVAILGLILGFSIPSYTKAVEKSHEKTGIINLATIRASIDIWKLKTGNSAIGDWNSLANINTALSINLIDTNLSYACSPTDPGGGPETDICEASAIAGWEISFHDDTYSNETIHCTSAATCPTCTTLPNTAPSNPGCGT